MTKEKKNNKLRQMLAKYYQKQADIYSGTEENEEGRAKKRVGLWLAVFLVVVGAGIAIIVGSGLGADMSTQNSSKETIYLPDFEAFSNGYAKREQEEQKYDDSVEIRYQVERGIEEIMEEYHNLLTKNYSYRLVYNSATRDEHDQIISEYYYVYMGKENVSKFMIESDEESFALQLMIKTTTAEDNSGVMEMKAIHEIQKQDSQEKTSFVPDVLLTPDFNAYANGYGVSLGTVTQENYIMTTYEFDADAVEFIAEEYRSTLEAGYPYEFVGEKEQESNDGWITKEYYYRYAGEEILPSFNVTTEEGMVGIQLKIAVLTKENSEEALVHLSSLEKTIWQDNGEKTTYVPLEITGIIFECPDLFFGKDKVTQENWIPVGYSMGYDFRVTYTGSKTKPFLGSVSSSDESILKKVEGKTEFLALAPGTVTVTATLGDLSVEKEITVYAVDRSFDSWLKLSQNTFEITSEEICSLEIDATLGFGTVSSSVNIIARPYGSNISYQVEAWSEVKDKTCSRKYIFEIDPNQFNKKSTKGIFFYLVKCDKEGNYDLNTDILDYQMVEFVWNIKE